MIVNEVGGRRIFPRFCYQNSHDTQICFLFPHEVVECIAKEFAFNIISKCTIMYITAVK